MNIRESVADVLNHEETVTKMFYESFLSRYPDVKRIFENVNLGRQALLLSMALPVIQLHYDHDYPTTRDYLEMLGSKHKERGVPEELYPDFCDCLLDTLEQFHGENWTENLEEQWSAAIQKAADTMLIGYRSTRFA